MEEEGFVQMDDESFMEMLRSREGEEYVFSPKSCLSSSPSSSCYSSSAAAQMLWFGGKEEEVVTVIHGVSQKSTDSSLSSLSSSPPSATISSPKSSSTKKAANTHGGRGRRTTTGATAAARAAITKKPKPEASAGPVTIMVRKEKLGERIMALQQLVSPFGKSDTASVLHEAQGYIRFLHDQVQVLSSPYLQSLPSSAHQHDGGGNDLRSRGLCLVPVACTEHVPSSNGADLWSPTVGNSRCSSSSYKH